ncbi:MAG: selenium-dependent molybdenum cofactor biosynthesis protein YqeB [Dehalococcoidia bacterium]|nr:selenium-dependent molybdenum cofactor biosynthesis protein YqeB [Dehalococcoidia bacterium]
MKDLKDLTILVRGAGEMATGVAHRLARSHFKVCLTEIARPQAVRREVSFCEAVYDGEKSVEGVTARLITDASHIASVWAKGDLPLLMDPGSEVRRTLCPDVVVDAILAKRNLGTGKDWAPLVIGLGPGFYAGRDVHIVVETNRGHNLGRLFFDGEAEPNTGVPGNIGGYAEERVLRAPHEGVFRYSGRRIGDVVEADEAVSYVGPDPVLASITGVLRGLLREGIPVHKGMKVGDVDPRATRDNCYTISDKARAIAGGVLEGIMFSFNR